MMENSDCRLCLKSSKRMCSLNESSKNGVPYWVMIQFISDIKRSNTEEKACVSCCRRLIDAYNFKMLIESTDTYLQNSNTSNRIIFNNLEDIKVKIEIPDDRITQENVLDNIQTDEEQFNYHDTLIKRVAEADRKPLSAVEFPNSIQEHSEDEATDYEYLADDDYVPDDEKHKLDDSEDEDQNLLIPLLRRKTRNKEYEPIKPRVTRQTKKLRNDEDYDENYLPNRPKQSQKKQVANKDGSKNSIGRPCHGKVLAVPIIPKVMDNVRLSLVKEPKIKCPRPRQICYLCGKACLHLKTHLLTHSGEYKYKCDKCQKSYTTPATLRCHMKTHRPKTIKCDQCIATFSHNYAYLSHKRHHIQEKNFICEICSKAFKAKYQLNKHKLHMHNIGLKEYKCDTCGKVCKSRELLRHHIRVHTGERPYKCEICSQPYSYKHDFNRHCLKKHGVLFKRRSVYVMNEEVLVKERALMRDLMLRMNGVDKDDLPDNPFEGPQGPMAYEQMMKFIETQQLSGDFQL